MRKFVVGHMDYFSNDLQCHKVEGDSAEKALREFMIEQGLIQEDDIHASIQEMKQQAFNCDNAVGIIEI